MGLKSFRRRLAFVAIVVGIGAAAAVTYRLRAASAPPAPIVGVVHKTEIRIAPEINGRMTSYRVSAGQEVRKGDALAVLSSPELTAAVEEAKANLATATANRANVDAGVRKEEVDTAAQDLRIAEANLALAEVDHTRTATLAAKDFASKQQLDEATASLDKAEANYSQLKAAYAEDVAGPTDEERAIARAKVAYAEAALADIEAKLAKTTLVAPVDGVVSLLVAEPGEVISPGQPVMTLEAANERWFTMTVREDFLSGNHCGFPFAPAHREGRPDRSKGYRASTARRIRGLARRTRRRRSRPQQLSRPRRPNRRESVSGARNDSLDRPRPHKLRPRPRLRCSSAGSSRSLPVGARLPRSPRERPWSS